MPLAASREFREQRNSIPAHVMCIREGISIFGYDMDEVNLAVMRLAVPRRTISNVAGRTFDRTPSKT